LGVAEGCRRSEIGSKVKSRRLKVVS
jgi:hypothetical protein